MAERPAEDKSGILPETSIFFYGIPAYGHLHSNLYLTGCLSAAGYRVVYYSMEPYRREIEANDCEFRAYPLDRDSIDASDGEKAVKTVPSDSGIHPRYASSSSGRGRKGETIPCHI